MIIQLIILKNIVLMYRLLKCDMLIKFGKITETGDLALQRKIHIVRSKCFAGYRSWS